MCGLVGYISFKRPLGAFKTALSSYLTQGIYVGGVRGRDSTGIFTIDRGFPDQTEVIKSPVDGGIFIDQFNVQQALADISDYSAVIAHHRKATKGATNTANAHPFCVGDITLVHNGSLFNHRTLGGGNQYIVDSAAIAHALSTHSKKEVLEQLDGSFALIWHDARDSSLNIARNSERPLALGLVEAEETLLIASEKDMLRWLANRNNVGKLTVLEPQEDTLFSWDLSNKDVKAKGNTTEAFTSKKAAWGGTYGKTTKGGAQTTTGNSAGNSSIPTKLELLKVLDKFSLAVGDRVEFTGTEFFPYATKLTHGALRGLDLGRAFEVISFDVPTGDYTGAKCTGVVAAVKHTQGYPTWVTVVLTDISIVERDYQKKAQSDIQADVARIQEARKRKLQAAKKAGKEGKDQGPKSGPICQYDCTVKCAMCLEKDLNSRRQTTLALPQQPSSGSASSTSGAKAQAGGDSEEAADESSLPEFVMGPNNIWITEREWRELTKDGCAYCTGDFLRPSEVIWTQNGEPLCYECDHLYHNIYGGACH